MTKNLDQTTITIIARGLHAAAEEMGVNLIRSAFFSSTARETAVRISSSLTCCDNSS